MDMNKLEKIVNMFEKANITNLELEVDDMKIKLRKNTNNLNQTHVNIGSPLPKEEADEQKGEWVKSPLVGTYHKTRGDNVELVKIGDVVKVGDVLCIIEAMKVMNEITATKDGIVLEIKPQEGAMVQYDQDLILIGEENV